MLTVFPIPGSHFDLFGGGVRDACHMFTPLRLCSCRARLPALVSFQIVVVVVVVVVVVGWY